LKTLSVVGRLGNEPELKFAKSGSAILNCSVACDYQKKDGDGYNRHVLWVRVIVFGKRAESLAKVLTKGMRVAASGDFQLNEWNKDGEKRVSVEVIANDIEPLFDKRPDGERQSSQPRDQSQPQGGADYGYDDSDNLPF
jgi:single-strand DNA-binding protein